jgi:hypothetical protein
MPKKKRKNKNGSRSAAVECLSYRTLSVRADENGVPNTVDEDARTIEVIAATEEPVEVFDFERYEIIKEVLLMSGVEIPQSRQVPLLDTHRRFDTSSVLGSIRGLVPEKDLLVGRAHFSSVGEVEPSWQKVREGHLTDFSVGYKPLDSQWIPEGESYNFKGRTFQGPVRVTKKWKIREVSLVPIGADELAKARESIKFIPSNNHQKREKNKMNKKLLAFLKSRGLKDDATDEEAQELLRTLGPDAWEAFRKFDQPAPVVPSGDPAADIATARAEAAAEAADETRKEILATMDEITSMGTRAKDMDLALECIREGLTADQARVKFFEKMTTDDGGGAVGHRGVATVQADASEKFRAAGIDALMARSSIAYEPESWAEGHRDLMGYSLKELAREALRIAGKNTGGNVVQMVGRALESSDLPYLLANVANKSLFSGWDSAPETWSTWCGTDQVSDFKTHSMPRGSEASDLDEVPEHGEYKYGKMTEAQEQYSIVTYGKIFAITRQAIINDDLGALTRIPAAHGEAAARKVGDVVYAVLTANAAMGDSIALFHASHANFIDNGSGAAPGTATIGAGILAMGIQKDLQGLRRLNIRPEFLLAPKALEGATEVFLTSIKFADHSTVATDSSFASTRENPYAGGYFNRVYDSRLDDDDAAAWYLAGPKGKTVVVFFLNGVQKPYLESKTGWNVDGTEQKVRIDVGAKAVDYRGLYFNDGN